MDPDLGSHCLPVCQNRFEKCARIFSRQHKRTTFSDAGFLGILRIKVLSGSNIVVFVVQVGCVKHQTKKKIALANMQNVQIQIILHMGKVSSGPLLSIDTFCSIHSISRR